MPTFRRTCLYCRREFDAAHSLANICSPECRNTYYPPRPPRPPAVTVKVAPPSTGPGCPRCGEEVRDTSGVRKYCSSTCRKAMQRKARQEKVRAGYVEPVSIAVLRKRDNDTCRICGQPVDFLKKPPDPHAATIDHVVALARGGEHSYKNTQFAHFRCNTSKGSD